MEIDVAGYDVHFGEVHYPEGFKELISGLTIPEQLGYFRIGSGEHMKKPYPERRAEDAPSERVESAVRVRSVIEKDGLIAGVIAENAHGAYIPCMAERRFCVKDEEPDSKAEYSYLLCVAAEFGGDDTKSK